MNVDQPLRMLMIYVEVMELRVEVEYGLIPDGCIWWYIVIFYDEEYVYPRSYQTCEWEVGPEVWHWISPNSVILCVKDGWLYM